MRTTISTCLIAVAALAFAGTTVLAQQDFPSKTMTLVVPWPPGGATDALSRILAQSLSQRLGQTVVVDNRPGAGGNIGTASFVREPADGHSLIMATSSTNAANPHLYSALGFDPVEDFEPVAFVATIPNLLEVPANSQFSSASELVAYAREHPGQLNFASGGVGSSQHLAGSAFAHFNEIEIVHVPYQGSGPAVTDLIAGHMDMMLDTGSLSQVLDEALRALAVAADERIPALPDVPTMAEAGLPAMQASAWYALAAPRGTPDAIVAELHEAVVAVLDEPGIRERLLAMGAVLRDPLSPGEVRDFFRSEVDRYQEIVERSGARID